MYCYVFTLDQTYQTAEKIDLCRLGFFTTRVGVSSLSGVGYVLRHLVKLLVNWSRVYTIPQILSYLKHTVRISYFCPFVLQKRVGMLFI